MILSGVREMAQRLRALTVLVPPSPCPRTWVWFPAHTWWLTSLCNSHSRGFGALFWLPQASGTHMVYIHTYRQNMYTHNFFLIERLVTYFCCCFETESYSIAQAEHKLVATLLPQPSKYWDDKCDLSTQQNWSFLMFFRIIFKGFRTESFLVSVLLICFVW